MDRRKWWNYYGPPLHLPGDNKSVRDIYLAHKHDVFRGWSERGEPMKGLIYRYLIGMVDRDNVVDLELINLKYLTLKLGHSEIGVK